MMISRWAFAFTSFAIVLSQPLSAQQASDQNPRTGSRISPQLRDHRGVDETTSPHAALAMTADCVTRKEPEQALAYLKTVPASSSEDKALDEMMGTLEGCLPLSNFNGVGNAVRARGTVTLRMDHVSWRGALAEAILKENDTSIDARSLAISDDGMFVPEQFHGARSSETSRSFGLGFAGCVMGNNPDSVVGLLSTEPGSIAERKAIIAMAPSFSQCVMEGQRLSIDPPTLRNQIAEVTYYALLLPAARTSQVAADGAQ